MSKRGWRSYNPIGASVFEILATSMLLKDTEENVQPLLALQAAIEGDPWWADLWHESLIESSIEQAYETHNLKLLSKAFDNRRCLAADALAEIERVRERHERSGAVEKMKGCTPSASPPPSRKRPHFEAFLSQDIKSESRRR